MSELRVVSSGNENTRPEDDAGALRVVSSGNDYEAPAKINALAAAGRNPAAVAKADTLGRKHGVPLPIAESNPEVVDRLELFERASKLPPRTAAWVAKDPDNAAVSRDDWDNLSLLEQAFTASKVLSPSFFMQTAAKNPDMLPSPVRAFTADFTRMFGGGIEGVAEVPGMIQREQDRILMGLSSVFGDDFEQSVAEAMRVRNEKYGWAMPDQAISKAGRAIGGTLNDAADMIDVPAGERDLVDDVFGGLGSAGAFLLTGYATGGAGVATMGFGVGVDQQADEARQAGIYGTLDADKAMASGGIVTSISESLGFKWLTRALPEPAKRVIATRLGDLLATGAGEAVQEGVENAGQNLVTQQFIDPDRGIFEGVADASGVGFAVGLIMRGGVHVAHSASDARSAVEENDALQQIMKISGGSKLFQMAPERYQDAVASLKTAGMADVYVPVNDWRTLFQSGQESDAARAAADVSDAEFAAALTTGGRVRVSTERFLTSFTPEQQAALAKNARFQPDGLLPEEARSFDARTAMNEYLARANFRPAGRDNEVYDEYVARLTGPYTRQEAEALAESVAAFVRGYGARAGAVDEIINLLVERTGLKAEVKLPKSVQAVLSSRRDVVPAIDSIIDMLRTREFPKDADLYGPTLSEAVRSWGGIDPNAFGAGDLAAMDAQRQQLFRADGITLEDALVKAVQDGYINKGLLSESSRYDTNAADLNDFIEALTKDMQGVSPVYSPQFANTDRQALVAASEELARELEEKGIDLEKVDNATARRQLGWFVDEPAAAEPGQEVLFQSEPAEADLRDPDRRWYYSATVQAVASSKLTKASGDQWLSTLRNMPGVKDDELAWLSVPEFLAGKKSVTRDELAEHVRQQQIVLEETVFGEQDNSDVDLPYYVGAEVAGQGFEVTGPNGSMGFFPTAEEAEVAAYDFSTGYLRSNGVNLPGLGDNFVVARVTQADVDELDIPADRLGSWGLFEAAGPDRQKGDFLQPLPAGASYASAVRQAVSIVSGVYEQPSAVDTQYSGLTIPGGKKYRELLLRLPVSVPMVESPFGGQVPATMDDARGVFRSSHWQQPNILAHVRFDERTDANGNRVLFVQEVQSDWAQVGRKHGFRSSIRPVSYPSQEKMLSDLGWKITERPSWAPEGHVGVVYHDGSEASWAADDVLTMVQRDWGLKQMDRFYNGKGEMSDADWANLSELVKSLQAAESNRTVPDAPFVTSTRAWVELAVKRMVAYAVENGYHSVAFPTPDLVPQIEDWGTTLEEIKNDPADSKRFGAILSRYAEDIPRAVRALAKKYGGRVVEADLGDNPRAENAFSILSSVYQYARDVVRIADLDHAREMLEIVRTDPSADESVDRAFDNAIFRMDPEEGGNERDRAMLQELKYIYSVAQRVGAIKKQIPNASRIVVPAIEVTPELRGAAMAGLPLFQRNRGKQPRGALQISDRREFILQLFKARDWSTFLHESGHLYLEAMREIDAQLRGMDPATLTADQQQVLADHDTILGFLGAGSFDEITRDHHEVWAETYEAYLREGRAPSTRLQSAFQKFSVWLKIIYRTLAGLPNQKLAPDIRAVMDRMLATDTEIAEAASLQGFVPKFADAASAGMTDDEYERYLEAVDVARREAEEAEMRRQYQFLNQSNKQWFRQERERVRQELSDELNNDPVYRAVAQMRFGTLPDGSPLPDGVRPVKLNSDALIDRYGWPFVRKHFSRMHAKDGASPDVVARAMGFESEQDMVDRITNTQPRTAYLNARTAEIMAERYPDPMASPDAALEAAAAVNNEAAEAVLVREIVSLGGNRDMARVLREAARRIVAATPVRELKPYKHQVAQQRAGREAIKSIAAGSKTEGLRALREQLMASYLLRESRDALERVEKIRAEAVRLGKKPAQERLAKAGDDYLANMNLLLGAYEFRRVSNKELSRRAGLRRWVEAMQEAGEVTAFTDDLLARVEAERVTNWRQVTVRELEELGEAMANLSHLAGLKNKLLSARQAADYEDAVTALLERIEQTLPETGPDVVDDADLGLANRAGEKVSKFFGELTRPEAWIEKLDGGESGPWHDFIWWPQEQSEDKIKGLQKRIGGLLKDLHKSLPKDFWSRASEDVTIQAQSGKVTVTRYTLMSLVLNKGNAGNRQRLRDGGITSKFGKVYQLTDAEVDSLPGLLTEAELRYVQGLWDVASSMRPEIEQTTRELAGIPVEFVEAVPFEIKAADGARVQMRGGYWPLVYHADRSRVGDRQSGDDALKVIMGMGFTSAFTSKGYTKNRVEELREPLRLNLGYVLAKNLNDVMIDVSYRKTVRDVQRLLKDPRIRSAIVARAGDAAYRAINGGLAYSVSANGDSVEATARTIGGASDFLMANAAVSILGIRPDIALGNYGSSLIQGLTRVDKVALLRGMRKLYLDKGDLGKKLAALSPFMVNRLEDGDYFYRQELAKTNQKMGFRAAYARVMMTLHRIADNQATQALWWGRFDQEMKKGATEDEAARLADKTIRMTQTANSRKDLAVFERDTQFKQSRMFMGPMMVQFAQIRKAYTGEGLDGWGARLALGWNALFVAPAIFALLAGRWPEDDEDDGRDAEDWAMWVAANTGVMFFMQTVPMLREAAAAAEQVMSDRPVNPRAAPTAQAVAQMVKSGRALAKEFGEDDPDYWKMTGDLVQLTSPVTAFPASQFKRYQRSMKWIEENPEASLQMQAKVMLYGPPR